MITREQIAQLLKSISEAHYQIHSYGWGDVPDLLAREDVIYPFLMVTPSSSTYEEGYATHTYTISIADRVLKDKANEVNVDSDTHQILLDILSQIDNLMYDDVDVVKGGTITPFFDNFRHEVTGHFADVGIRVKFAYDSCAVPSDIVPLPLPPPFECADASYRVQYVNGTLIEEGTIVSGGSKTINVPNPSICDPANYEVRDSDGNVLYSGTIASGGTENIVVTNSTIVVRKSDNTIISSVSVLAQGSVNYQVADSVITLTDTDGATLITENVKATDPATIVAPNGTLNVNKSDGVLISGQVVKSGETKGYNVADSVVSNSDASYTANVKATDPLTLPDQQININGVDQGDIASVGTIDFNITDGVNPVLPNSVVITGRTVDIEVSTGGGSLTVDFSVDDATPDTNQTITFTDLTVGATAWVWNFGDGTSSSLQNPTKVYAHSGIYTVTLAATDGTSSGEEIKTSFITCSLQALPSANLQMHNSALIGASPSNATLVSGTISQWNDDINSYHRTQGTPANRPTYLYPAITAPNGIVYGAARFDGLSDFLQNNNAAFTRGTGSFEVLVLKRNAALGVGRVISESASAGNLFELFYVTNTRELGLFNGSIQNNIQSLQIGTWAILLVHWNQASSSINWNNKSIGNAAGTIGNNSAVGSTLGAAFNGGLAAQFDFLEHIIYTAKPSDSDIALIIQRIISQYGNIF